jgi:meiotically up-regulated gene 157 (Mug157) protein
MMAVTALTYANEMCRSVYHDDKLAEECLDLAKEIEDGIKNFGIREHLNYGKIYAYETDGRENYLFMDDANSPSLLSIPYIGYCDKENEIYQNTRKFILSGDNPYYARGTYAKGVGSPHTPEGYVWHIGIIMQALTSTDRNEIMECLDMIIKTHAGTNYMHESFDPDNPKAYTRSWFAWANTLFAELLDDLCTKKFF